MQMVLLSLLNEKLPKRIIKSGGAPKKNHKIRWCCMKSGAAAWGVMGGLAQPGAADFDLHLEHWQD